MAVPDPAILAAIAKAKAAGLPAPGTTSGGTGSSALFPGFKNQPDAGAAPVWTIPLWRNTFKRPVKDAWGDGTIVTSEQKAGDQYSPDDAKVQFGALLMDKAKLHEWGDLAWKAGWISADNRNDASALASAWVKAVDFAANVKQATNGNTELTPFEMAKWVAQATGSQLLATQADAAAHFTGNRTVETTTDKRPPANSGDVLHQLLGRNPTAGEQATYQHGLNQVAAAHPISTERVGHYVDGALTSSTSTVTGGYDEHAAQIQQASSASPDVASNQQATTYYDALIRAIGGGG